jgi:murein DD-endopeptidase MepM/ murein hydrolase activator NlpD
VRATTAARVKERASRARRAAAAAPAPRPEVARPGAGALTSRYGSRWGRLHAGIDLAAGIGSPVVAAADGTVVTAGEEGGYGRVVRLQHGQGTVTVYAHLSEVLVEVGQAVQAGSPIAREGNSGHSTGPHLHFEVRIGDVPVDPVPWLRERGVGL